jgi:hypothetical protein
MDEVSQRVEQSIAMTLRVRGIMHRRTYEAASQEKPNDWTKSDHGTRHHTACTSHGRPGRVESYGQEARGGGTEGAS